MKFRLVAVVCIAAAAAAVAYAQTPSVVPPPPPGATIPQSPVRLPVAGEAGAVTRTPTGAEARGDDAPASRWQADLDRLDADLRLRLLSANEPRIAWLAGELDTTDIESQVRHYAAARTAAPGERLYLASLGVACLQRVRPTLPSCDAMDRLADWARRDSDNGVPMLLLAERAHQRGEADLAAGFVEQAALAPRFDDYWSQGALRWWTYLRALDGGVDPAVKAKAAANYASIRDFAWAVPLRVLCAESGERGERMRNACVSIGQALAARGATFALRRAGARVVEINAADASARTAAQRRHAAILATTARCTLAQPDFVSALESARPAERATGVEQFAAWASAQSDLGEVAACERMLASVRK